MSIFHKGQRLLQKYRTQKIVSTLFIFTLAIILFLSIINVFTLPSPIRPRTSVGWMNILSIVLLVLGLELWRIEKRSLKSIKQLYGKPLDFFILGYLSINALSLLLAPSIYSLTNIKLLANAGFIYFISQMHVPNQNMRSLLLHILGAVTVMIGSISIFQMITPSLVNSLAYSSFGGTESYGLVMDYKRGRLLHWGSITLSFTSFYASLLLAWKNRSYTSRVIFYGIVGFSVLSLAMVSSNFRWTLFCFLAITSVFAKVIISYKLFTYKYFLRGIPLFVGVAIIGLVLSKGLLGYNILDRFLLTNSQRDVNETLGRFYLYNQSFNVFLASPVYGTGMGNYLTLVDPHELIKYFSIYDQTHITLAPIAPHNDFFLVLAEGGIIGLVFFIMIVYLTMKQLYLLLFREGKMEYEDMLFLLTAFCSYLAFILYGLFENIFPNNFIFLFFLSGMSFSWFSTNNKKV